MNYFGEGKILMLNRWRTRKTGTEKEKFLESFLARQEAIAGGVWIDSFSLFFVHNNNNDLRLLTVISFFWDLISIGIVFSLSLPPSLFTSPQRSDDHPHTVEDKGSVDCLGRLINVNLFFLLL